MKSNQNNYLNNRVIDVDMMIEFVESKRGDHEFIKKTLIKSGVYDKDMKLTEKYKSVDLKEKNK